MSTTFFYFFPAKCIVDNYLLTWGNTNDSLKKTRR